MEKKHGVIIQQKWSIYSNGGYKLFDTKSEAEIYYKKHKSVGMQEPLKINYMLLKPSLARSKERNPHFKHPLSKQQKDKIIRIRSRM